MILGLAFRYLYIFPSYFGYWSLIFTKQVAYFFRLYARGVVVGHRRWFRPNLTRSRCLTVIRGKRVVNPNWSLIKIEGVKTKEETDFYLGKKVAWLYKAQTADKNGSKIRAIWGKIARPHGNTGVVRAKFRSNLPGQSFGKPVRIMLYPSRV